MLSAGSVRAQSDIEKPMPNVLLLVDTSGSMEFKASDNALPICDPLGTDSEKSRWIDLVEVLTGSFGDYSCFAQDRNSNGFRTEFMLGTYPPYDWGYINPFNRPLSSNCVVGPGVEPPSTAPYSFPSGAVDVFEFSLPDNVSSTPGCPAFNQAPNGLLDVFKDKVRFGLMTFDSHVDPGSGLSGGTADWVDGMRGTWSYYVGDSVTGKPAGCLVPQDQEVGARNAAAPPWEGRMVAFGAPGAELSEIEQRNGYIQDVLTSTRPYGATPIAGLLDDARQFLWYDSQPDPLDNSLTPADFGPRADPATLVGDCRRNYIVLLTDGEPNLDLRPHCAGEDGICPYETPEDIAYALRNEPANDPDQWAEVVVIAFALSEVTLSGGTTISCEELTDEMCNNPADAENRPLQACCRLNRIAAFGGTPNSDGTPAQAYFPSNAKELRRAFSSILAKATANVTTRTVATYSSGGASGPGGNQQFSSGFVPVLEQPWRGTLTRTRVQCTDGVAQTQPVAPELGDDFAANLNTGLGHRSFYTFMPTSAMDLRDTIRPLGTTLDGLGSVSGQTSDPLTEEQLASAVDEDMMQISSTACDLADASQCAEAIMRWEVGLGNSDGESRCPSANSEECSLLGAIYHSTPVAVSGAPSSSVLDESYDDFKRLMERAERPSVLYTSSADGMLHAFKTAPHSYDPNNLSDQVRTQSNNELWALMPPAVIPLIQSQYPNAPATLLDGLSVIKDVPLEGSYYQRSLSTAESASGDWSTVLVQGFGKGQVDGGYFAVDIRLPVDPADNTISGGGPKFLWQITRDSRGDRLFGSGGTPLITNLYVKSGTDSVGSEVAVAVLPGGSLGTRDASTPVDAGPTLAATESQYNPASQVASYADAEVARSLTIVRLDTGEVLRTFRSALPTQADEGIAASRTTVVDIPAPITGAPVSFPGGLGVVADRAYVGDAEGRVWRVDLSSGDPADWSMKVFLDTYVGLDLEDRQPIETAPVLSVDDRGRITLAVATGDQSIQSAGTNMRNRVVSATEVFDDESQTFQMQLNWVQTLGCDGECGVLSDGTQEYIGERVTGPISLFGGYLYFATSSPGEPSAGSCGQSLSRVWGVHYTQSRDDAIAAEFRNPFNGPNGAFEEVSTTPGLREKVRAPATGVVFGVSIEALPTCSQSADGYSGDPYLGGFGSHQSTTTSPSQFYLVTQVGGVSSATSGPSVVRQQLAPPRSPVVFDSWARIFE